MIARETKSNILAHFDMENISFSGRMNDLEFLNRLYPLREMKSHDSRCENAYTEISLHTVANYDYQGNWPFHDERFGLLNGSDEVFLRFVCEMAHPLVRQKLSEADRILTISNDWLKEDGWELFPAREIAGGKILSFRQIDPIYKPKDDEVAHIWESGKLRFFISHRDLHKVQAKKLAENLNTYGISSFVAHDSIQAMSTWKNEIMKALLTMDACLCYITNDFYESAWTNQEVGFALARGIPIYLYSADGTDPQGFKLDTQAIKAGLPDLLKCIKRDFCRNTVFKRFFIQQFCDAIDGSFEWAKNKFFALVGLDFSDAEIEQIANAFSAKAKYSNQLAAVLTDPLSPEHKKHPLLRNYTHYRDYLNNEILKLHSSIKFEVIETKDEWGSAVIRIERVQK